MIFLGRQSWALLILALLANLLAGLSMSGTMAIFDWGVREPGEWRNVCLALLVACCLQFTMQIISTRLLLTISLSALLDLRLQLCRRILASPQETLQKIGKARLFAVLTHDATTLVDAYQAIIIVIRNIVVITAGVLYLAWISWPFAVLAAALLLLGMAAIHFLTKTTRGQLIKLREAVDFLYKYLRELTDGVKELQLNNQRSTRFLEGIVNPIARQIRDQSIRSLSRFEAVGSFGEIAYVLGVGAILFVLPRWTGIGQENVGSVAIVLLFMSTSISATLYLLPTFGSARTSFSKIEQLAKELPQEAPIVHVPVNSAATEQFHLQLRNVRYDYSESMDRQFQVGPIDLDVRSGEIVFIAGGNGSGKSTLAMLLTGLYAPTVGQICLNDIPIADDQRHRYRQNFSAIFSDFHLFEHLSEENDGLSAQAGLYLDKLSLSNKVSIEGSKFSTIDLSAGQRKRLALVNAYLEDRPCYLFDEWAADQDPEFKRFFYRQLLPELKAHGKAIIAITHDDAYFDCADRILRLEDGKVAAEFQVSADKSVAPELS